MTDKKITGKDRRKFKRVTDSFSLMYRIKSPFNLRIQYGEKELDAIAEDISEEGIGLTTNREIPPGTVIGLRFNILNDSTVSEEYKRRSFELEGEIRYSSFLRGKDYRLGILLLNISPEERDFLAHYVKTQTSE